MIADIAALALACAGCVFYGHALGWLLERTAPPPSPTIDARFRSLGIDLFPWQRDLIARALEGDR